MLELLDAIESLEELLESLFSETDDSGVLSVEELEICVSPILLVFGLVEESSPQAEKTLIARNVQTNSFVFIRVPLFDKRNINKYWRLLWKLFLL